MHHTRSTYRRPTQAGHHQRSGSILVAALVCLAIVTLILLSVFRSAISQRRQIRLEQQQVQAELLAESGLERAVARLNSNPNYVGEEWTIDAKQLDTRNPALVKITVARQDKEHQVTVEAVFPRESLRQSRCVRSLRLATANDEKSSGDDSPPDPTIDSDRKAEVPE